MDIISSQLASESIGLLEKLNGVPMKRQISDWFTDYWRVVSAAQLR